MRLQRYGFIFLAIYIVFIAGGYAVNIPQVRWFHHIFMTILALGWLGWRIWHKRGIPPSPTNIVLIAMLSLGFITIPFSHNPRMALEFMWTPVMFALTFWFMVNVFHRAQDRMLMEVLFLVTALVIFLSAIQISDALFAWIGIIRSSGQGWIEFIGTGITFPIQSDLRIFLPLGVSTQVAGFVAPIIIISLAWAISTDKKAVRTILSGMMILLSIILILTFSRGGLISVTVGLFSFFVLRIIQADRVQSRLTRRNLSIIGSLLILASIVGVTVLAIGSQGGRKSGDSVRLDLWRSAIEMTVDNPVTGVGTGLYGHVLREYRQFETARDRLSTAHNIYLTVTAEHGLAVILILLGTIWSIGYSWWQLRLESTSNKKRLIRLNGMMAALIAFAIHNLFDTLTTYAAISLFSLMVVYCTIKPAKSSLDERPKGNQLIAIVTLIIVLAYGIWFVAIVDRAHSHFINSTNSEFDQLAEAELALEIDATLNLYSLQVAYLFGAKTIENPNEADLVRAIELYEAAILLEPTWDTGMINLAALYEANGQPEQALERLAEAQTIILNPTAHLHWARIADANDLASDEAIVENYLRYLQRSSYLPLSNFWTATPLREQALQAYSDALRIDHQYRIAQIHYPERLNEIVSDTPQTAADWWVVGEHALSIENDLTLATEAFSQAIKLDLNNGDYYVSRADVTIESDIEAAERDLQIARFLGTRDEYPNVLLANIESEPDSRITLIASAIPGLSQLQEFEGVLYNGRVASFVPYPSVRHIGRGDTVMQIWYDLAAEYEANGDTVTAIQVYEAIAFLSPEDSRAVQEIERLQP